MINAQRQIMVILCPLSFRDSESRDGRRQIMVIPHTFSPSRGDRVRWHAETNYGHFSPCVNQEERIRQYQDDVGHSILIIFKTFCRFRWQGDWPAKWCFARTKLVSYLYFPFISNKRQVKRGNCHTLISFGDHPFVGMRPSFDHFKVLGTHR